MTNGYAISKRELEDLPGSEVINPFLWQDFVDAFPAIAPDADAQEALRSTLRGLLHLRISALQKQEALRHILELHGDAEGMRAYYRSGWTFPDGHPDLKPFTVFEKDASPVGLAGISYEVRNRQPVCELQVVQGLKGTEVRLEELAARVIKTWQEMHKAEWQLVLANPIKRYNRLRDRFFDKTCCNEELGHRDVSVTRHRINVQRAKLQELWGLKGGKEA